MYLRFLNIIARFAGSIPYEYTQLYSLIGRSASSYIDTGIIPQYGMTFVINAASHANTGFGVLAGCRGVGTNRFQVCLLDQSSNKIQIGFGSYESAPFPSYAIMANINKYVTICNLGSQSISINDLQVLQMSYTGQLAETTIYLFNENGNSSASAEGVEIKDAAIQDEQGNLVRKFIPVQKKDTLELGVYDIVTKTFLPCVGTFQPIYL